MCFSATASFIAGGALSAVGVATLAQAKSEKEIPFASFPLLLGIQQTIEGFVWLSFGNPALNAAMVYAYSLFSHVLWPILVPIAVLLIEPDPVRKRAILGTAFVGLSVGLYLLYSITNDGITASIVDRSIAYRSDHLYPVTMMLMYLIAVCGSCMISSHAMIRLFGTVLLGSFAIALLFFYTTFFSVWCFFAAILSVIVYLYFRKTHVGV